MNNHPHKDYDGRVAYARGRADYRAGLSVEVPPYTGGFDAREWRRGWRDARDFWLDHPWPMAADPIPPQKPTRRGRAVGVTP